MAVVIVINYLHMKKTILVSMSGLIATLVILNVSNYFHASLYQPRSDNGKMNKMNRPSEHFFLQRSYPDSTFDLHAYESVLKQEQLSFSAKRGTPNSLNSDWASEGPGNIGGRINTVAVHPANSNIIYAGNAAGGIFKTINGGTTWVPIFDDRVYLAIGCITLDPNDPNTIYVGTGDPNITGNPAIGDGIFKSTDGGSTWVHLGLTTQRIISRIIIDPTNSSTIYAATMGLPFVPNTDRGLYKSINGGSTWHQVLYISSDAGIIDLVIDPFNSQTLYAAGWNRISNNQQGIAAGPAAKIYKSTDGGASWNILGGGLPTGNMSRIGLCHSKLNPNTMFAMYVGTTWNLEGIYKTTNGGISWVMLSTVGLPASVFSGFGWYFGQIRVNPNNDNELFILSVDLYKTTNGGDSWFMAGPPWYDYTVHADKHDLVFIDANTLLLATDGGLYKSTDGGINYTDIEDIPNTQFYRIGVNPHDNTMYYGGAQDNGTMSGNAGTINTWQRMWGGDGFQILFDAVDPLLWYVETQYGGLYYTNDGGNYYYYLTNGLGAERRSWDMPFIMSKSNSSLLYTGTYRIYRMNAAPTGTWSTISGDLTDGNIYGGDFHVITTIDESALNIQHLYAGTSDGNVWRTLNNGSSWTNITSTLPNRYVTCIKSSPDNMNTVIVSHSGYKSNDFIPHVHKSTNNGTSWTDISGDLPQLAVNDILILKGHNDKVILAATDGGVYRTLNGGTNWERIGGNMPVMPVYDIDYNSTTKKLIAGTFARSLMTFPMDSIVDKNTSISDKLSEQYSSSVYPSPATNQVTLDIAGNVAGESAVINIFSTGGRLVKTITRKNSEKTIISINDLSSGTYIIKTDIGDKTLINRFVKIDR